MISIPPNFARLALAVTMAFAAQAVSAQSEPAKCRFIKIASIKIETRASQLPMVDGSINGKRTRMLVDTGASSTAVMRKIAEDLGLPLSQTWRMGAGVSGESQAYNARVKEFTFGPVRWENLGLRTIWDTPNDPGFGAIIGADFLFRQDLEVAMADHEIRFFKPDNCADAHLAYWDPDAQVVALESTIEQDRRPVIQVEVNGQPMRALVDTGAQSSIITLSAARRAGITSTMPDVVVSKMQGIGKTLVQTWIAPMAKFKIGDVAIGNSRIVIGDLFGALLQDANNPGTAQHIKEQPEMLIGQDFLRAYRVLFAVSQRKFYFSHVGGPVFSTAKDAAKPE